MITPKVWGFEDEIVNLEYCGKRMFVKEQFRCSVHCHNKKDEVLMVANDDGVIWFEIGTDPDDMTCMFLQCNERIRVKPGTWHRFLAIHDTNLMEFSTHHDDDDSVRRELSEKVQDNEFKSLLRSYYAFQNKDRILTIEASGVVANELKKRGRVIGMCNGCFDLTHLGHVSLFEQAKSRCDVLFVAVNSDQSVKSLKGPTRPFVDFKGRLGMVASNRFVDYVVMSEKTSHLDVVDAVKPSIYIATTETSSKSPEAREILLYGGKVEVVEMLPNYNTTSIATKISRTE